jgi:cation diffusion facilitator CzcD-associated flavoprotein CzcO
MSILAGTADEDGRRHRVVVIGSGFGGLTATKALKRAPVDVTMIKLTITGRQARAQQYAERATQPDAAARVA